MMNDDVSADELLNANTQEETMEAEDDEQEDEATGLSK
jgi:hypothetical protein